MVATVDRFIGANGLRFHYLEWGNPANPVLLLLHGFANQAHIWDSFAASVADRYHVLALDQRGHGDSDHAAEYGDELNAADAAAICLGLGIEALSIVGFSMGGVAAMLFASVHPEHVHKLVLVDVGPEMDPRGRERLAGTIRQARTVFPDRESALAYIRLANPRMSEKLVLEALGYAFREQPDASYRLKYDERLRELFGTRLRPIEELWQGIRDIPCPTLIVRGGDSDLFMESTAQKMVEVMPDARFVTVPGATHGVMVDQREEFNRVLGAFL